MKLLAFDSSIKKFIIPFLFLLACTSKPEANRDTLVKSEKGMEDSTEVELSAEATVSLSEQLEEPKNKRQSTPLGDNIKESLSTLSNSGVFKLTHEQMVSSLNSIHSDYFLKNSEYKLLSSASGNIFSNNRKDHIFIIFDTSSTTISFIVYNSLNLEYSILYQDIPIEEGTDSDSCHYGSSGTLDYQFAQEIAWHKDGFLKNQISFKEYMLTSAGTLDSNKNIAEDYGCYYKNHQKESSTPSICFATSLVYNNWECLKYDSLSNTFITFYGQAFAD